MKEIILQGGGGAGGGSSFTQTPDNLRSTDTFEGLLGLCAGPILGPVNGLKSISLNGTPIEDASGTLNFTDFTALVANGDPGLFPQSPTLQLGSGGSPVAVNLPIGNTNPAGTPGPWVVKTNTNLNADFIDLRFIVNALYSQTSKGIFAETANLEIEMKPTGSSTWIVPFLTAPTIPYSSSGLATNWFGRAVVQAYVPRSYFGPTGTPLPITGNGYIKITGKTTSPYVYELRIETPNKGAYANRGWDVRVRLREVESVDADPNFNKRSIQWESITAVYSDVLGTTEEWRGLAWLHVIGKATDQLNNVPEVRSICKTKIVSVPPSSVFNPTTRTYTTGIWDGSFVKAFTTDPAWIINDALSDGLSGISSISPGCFLNKWDALEASKWFSELVPDGAGGTHPRYNLNVTVDQLQKADEFVRYLAGAVGGYAWDTGNGEWRLKVDKPENPVDIFTLENIEGEFSYNHTDVDSRYNDIKVTFLNEAMDYREDYIQVYDSPAIAQYGRKPTSIVGVGCTNRQEALRRGMLRLKTSVNETKMVNFTTNRRGKMLNAFDTILVADRDLGTATTGRVVAIDALRTTLTLRDTVRLEVGVTYQIRFSVTNPNYVPDTTSQPTSADWRSPTTVYTFNVVNTSVQRGDVKVLYLGSALPAGTAEFLTVALEAVGLPTIPKMYRILEIRLGDDGERVAISALEVDTTKWAAADAVTPSASVITGPTLIVPPPLAPTSGSVLSLTNIPNHYSLVANWQRPASGFITGFKVAYRFNNGPLIVLDERLSDTSYELMNPTSGVYDFEISTVDRRGVTSLPLTASLNVTGYEETLAAQITAASSAAATANAALANIASDSLLTPDEKPSIILNRDVIINEQAGIDAQATAFGVTTEKIAYDAAVTALTTYLATLTTPVLWSNLTGNTTIVGTTFRTKFSTVYSTRQALLNKIAAAAANNLSPLGSNLVINSDFTGGLTGFSPGLDGTTGRAIERGLNLSGWSGVLNVAYATAVGTAPAVGTMFDGHRTMGTGATWIDQLKKWAVGVVPGDRLYFSILAAGHRCQCYATLHQLDGTGTYVTEEASPLTTTGNFAGGDPANATRVGAFVDIPVGSPIRYVYIEPRALCPGGSPANDDPYLFWAQAFIAKVAPGQTTPPPYTSGPAPRDSNLTADWPTVSGTGKPADNATRNDDTGNLLESPVKLDTYQQINATVTYEGIGGSGLVRDNWRLRLDGANAYCYLQAKPIPVFVGEKIFMNGAFYSGGGPGGNAYYGAHFYGADGTTFVANSDGEGIVHPGSTPAGWVERSGTMTVPSGAAYMKPYFSRDSGTGGSYYASELYLGRQQRGADKTSQNTAANVTTVGSTPASTVEAGGNKANNGLDSSGNVLVDKVGTSAILDNSVISPASAFSSGSITIPLTTTPSSRTTLQTISVASVAGYTVALDFGAEVLVDITDPSGFYFADAYFELYRDTTRIYFSQAIHIEYASHTGDRIHMSLDDAPGTGVFTYTLEAYLAGAGCRAISYNRLIRAPRWKK